MNWAEFVAIEIACFPAASLGIEMVAIECPTPPKAAEWPSRCGFDRADQSSASSARTWAKSDMFNLQPPRHISTLPDSDQIAEVTEGPPRDSCTAAKLDKFNDAGNTQAERPLLGLKVPDPKRPILAKNGPAVWRAALVASRRVAVLVASKAWNRCYIHNRRRLLLCGCRALLRQDGSF